MFAAPSFSLLWAIIPFLRDWPIGEDSPMIGAVLGFGIGCQLGAQLLPGEGFRKITLWSGLVLFLALLLAGICIQGAPASLGAIFAWIIWLLFGAVSVAGLLVAGIFGWAAWRPTLR